MTQSIPEITTLLAEIRALVQAGRSAAERQVNSLVVTTNFEVGRRIVVHEQGGENRAEYGKAVLQSLSESLTADFGRGWSMDTLGLMRRFYLAYRDRMAGVEPLAAISETLSRKSGGFSAPPTSQTPSAFSGDLPVTAVS